MELLGLIFGGVFRIIPELGRLWEAKNQREHEREMVKLQMQADQLRAQLEVQKMERQGEIQMQLAELQAMITALQAQGKGFKKTGIKFIDWLLGIAEFMSVTVRPVLTYWYCLVGYGAYKVASYYMILSAGSSWQNAITLLWTPNDHAVMLSIIGFWFVDRALRNQQAR
jgi:hypothetical protein